MALFDRLRKNKGIEKPPTGPERARSGSVNTAGFISSTETNQNLVWPRDLDTYLEMARTDTTVRWMLSLLKAPILAAEWNYEPPKNPTPEEVELTAFCQHAVFEELEDGFAELLRKALKCFDYGHSVFEIRADYRPVEFTYTMPDGSEKTTAREAFVVARAGERLQRTIAKWNVEDKDPSKLVSIEQWIGDGRGDPTVVTDANRLIVFTLDREGDDFRGQSILRPAYRSWRYKLQLENLEAIGIERSTGLPVAYMPNADDTEQDAMVDAFAALRQMENPYIIVPRAKWSPQSPEGWLVEFPNIMGDGGADPDPAIMRHEAAMARNILAEFMRLGHSGEGARSTGDVQQDPYWSALNAIVDFLQRVLHEGLTKRLCAWNYDAKRLPTLKATKIQGKDVQVIADAVQKLAAAQVLIPDAKLEDWVRDILDAPEAEREGEDPHAALLQQKLDPPAPKAPVGPDGQPVKPAAPEPGKKPNPKKPGGPAKMAEYTPHRALRPEEEVLALSDIVRTLDGGEARIEEVAARLGTEMLRPALQQADAAVEHRSPEAVNGISVDHASLADAIFDVLSYTYARGREEVAAEIARQIPAAAMAERTPPPDVERAKRLRALADTVASSVASAAMRALRSLTLRRIEHPEQAPPTGPGFDPLQTLVAEAKRAGRPTIGQVFADGRSDQMLIQQDQIDKTVYSAILDGRNCMPCAITDGEEAPVGGGTPVPNPNCEGGAACRCVRIPVVSSDRSGIPAEIGPGYVIE